MHQFDFSPEINNKKKRHSQCGRGDEIDMCAKCSARGLINISAAGAVYRTFGVLFDVVSDGAREWSQKDAWGPWDSF